MTRSTADWRALLDGAVPGPWRPYVDCGMMSVDCAADGTPVATDLTLDDAVLAASAPEAVAEVIRLRESIEKLADHWQSLDISTYQDTTRPLTVSFSEAVSELRQILRGAV